MWIPFGKPDAEARIAGGKLAPCLCGTVKFYRMGNSVLVVADLRGLPVNRTGFFGMHIHDGGDCGAEGFADTGGHFNPGDRPHPNHAGDLPPLIRCAGKAFLAVLTDRFCVGQILGKTLVIHHEADDFHTQPAGNAGEKIACGAITAC